MDDLDKRVEAAEARWEEHQIKATEKEALKEAVLFVEQGVDRIAASGPLSGVESVKLAHHQRIAHLRACVDKLKEMFDKAEESA